jgi:hypothetical protein
MSIFQATGEAFSPKKGTSNTSTKNCFTFSIFVRHYALLDPDPHWIHPTKIIADPCGSGSTTPVFTMYITRFDLERPTS